MIFQKIQVHLGRRLGFVGLIVLMALVLFILQSSRRRSSLISQENPDIPIIQDVPRDAIPPLDFPKYESADEATWLLDDDVVLGAEFNGDARVYPLKILNWHEIVNETIGGKHLVVTYCPLCRSGIVFSRELEGRLLTFGNTGALYESDMVMYDRETGSYWYQVGGRAIKGELFGKKLTVLPSFLITWKDWRSLHPNTKVLSLDTGFVRNYDSDPYRGYDALHSPPAFPVSISDDRLAPKEKVIGLIIDGVAKAYPVRLAKGTTLRDEFQGRRIEVVGDEEGLSAQVFFVEDGNRVPAPTVATFWFSWAAANPGTLIYGQDSAHSSQSSIDLRVPVILHPVRNSGAVSTERTDENIRSLFAKTQSVWDQANIVFAVELQEIRLDAANSDEIKKGNYRELYSIIPTGNAFHVFFVRSLNGNNGTAVGPSIALVADVTTVNDFRATAHELGHLMGLQHTLANPNRLMYQGVNGTTLLKEETTKSRSFVASLSLL